MATIDVSIKCAKELTELGEGVAKLIATVKKAAADGLTADDISPIATSAFMDLVPAVDGFEKISGEFQNDLPSAVNGCMVTASRILEVFIKKDAP